MGAKMIGHVHVTDSDRYYPGHAQIDFYPVIEALYDVGYTGQVAFEISPLPDAETAAKRGLGYLAAILEQVKIRRAE